MRGYRDSKLMAKTLRQGLVARGLKISHSVSLELVAKQFGFDNWNILAAKLDRIPSQTKLVMPDGWEKAGRGRNSMKWVSTHPIQALRR